MTSVVFVDPGVIDADALLSGLAPSAQVVLMTDDSAGLAQMAESLRDAQGLSSVHVLAHSADGMLVLGGTRLNIRSLGLHERELALIGASLADGGEIVLYGCEIAKSASGRKFVDEIARLTGAHVVASSTLTGSAAQGADWDLQYRTGGTATGCVFSQDARMAYPHVLIDPHPLFGDDASNVDLSRLDGANGFRLDGGAAGDQSGFAVSIAGDVNGDGYGDFLIGAFGADIGDIDTGAAHLVFGRASAFTAASALSALANGSGIRLIGSAAGDFTGRSVASAGDFNGDGLADLIIGASLADGNGIDAGMAYIVLGSSDALPATIDLAALDGATGFGVSGLSPGDQVGSAVARAGDINADGYDDLIVGAPHTDSNGADAGAAYILFGSPTTFSADVDLAALNGATGFRVIGFAAGDFGGSAVAGGGDINGDGIDDIIIGAWGSDPIADSDGTSYVVFGRDTPWGSTIDVSALDGSSGFRMIGAVRDRAGVSVAFTGDVNGDGYDDIIVGASAGDGGGTNSGTAYVVFGKAGSFAASIDLASLDGSDGFRLAGVREGDNAGRSVASAGDLNGDGYDDLIVGAINAGAAGDAYVVYGKASGFVANLDLAQLDGRSGFRLSGVTNDDDTGRSVSGGGDINGDGFDDVLIGANLADPSGSASGASYVFLGGDFTGAVTRLGTSGNDWVVGTPGADILVGMQGADTLVGNGGADVLIGGAGNDRIEVAELAFRRIDGGSGTDTLVVAGGGLTLDLTILPDNRIEDIERIDLTGAGNNTLVLDVSDVLSLSSTGNHLRVQGDAGDVVATRDWTFVAFQSVGPETYRLYTQGAATLQVDTDVVVANAVVPLTNLGGIAGTRITGAGAGDLAGTAVRGAGDLNGDGFTDFMIGAPSADPNGDDSGTAYVVFGNALPYGPDLNLALLDGASGFRLSGASAADALGASVAAAGDINGDGFDDIVVGAPGVSANGVSSGAAYVVFGKPGGYDANIELAAVDGATGFRISGAAANDQAGASVDGAGDLNGDGYADLIIGAPGADAAVNGGGAAYVVFGRSGAFGADLALSTLNGSDGFRLTGIAQDDLSGTSVARAGDVNGDGFDDLIVGARAANGNIADSGAAYVIFGQGDPFAATVSLANLDGNGGFMLLGLAVGDQTGFDVGPAGDVNGDGFDDIIVGAFSADIDGIDSGTSYVVFGKGTPWTATLALDTVDGTNGFRLVATAGDHSGVSVRSAGDVNSDGYDDLIVGASRADANGESGASYVVYGKGTGFSPTVALASLDGRSGFKLAGAVSGDLAGRAVSGAGDVNGDGYADILTGAPGADLTGNDAGAAYLVYGGNFSGAVTRAGTSGPDSLQGNHFAADTLVGGSGNDWLRGLDHVDTLRGGSGNDTLDGGNDPDRLYGDDGNDILIGDPGDDRLYGGAGDDLLIGHNDNDRLEGEGGDDLLFGGWGDDVLIGGTGADQGWGEHGADLLLGGTGDDILYGESGVDRLYGDEGNDTLYGGEEADLLLGGTGNDHLYGDVGDDSLFGGDGVDRLIGEEGDDRAYGGNDADDIFGQAGADLLIGEDGDDRIFGGIGSDLLFGAAGDDLLLGEDDADRLFGGEGNDLLFGQHGNDELQSDAGNDRLFGGEGDDLLFGQDGNDELQGEIGNDRLFGGEGDDDLFGQGGNDELQGEAGNDRLFGGDGDDLLVGWAGDDILYGGAGADRFVITPGGGLDIIADFEDSLDAINLRAYATANSGNTAIVAQGADTLVTFVGGESVLLIGVTTASVTAADFQFI